MYTTSPNLPNGGHIVESDSGHNVNDNLEGCHSSPTLLSATSGVLDAEWVNDGIHLQGTSGLASHDRDGHMYDEYQVDSNGDLHTSLRVQPRPDELNLLVPRQMDSSVTSSSRSEDFSMTSATPRSTSDTPFFADPTTLVRPPQTAEEDGHDIAKRVLEFTFLGLAVVLVVTLFSRRLYSLRSQNRPLTQFFSYRSTSQDTVYTTYRPHRSRRFSQNSHSSATHLRHPSGVHLLRDHHLSPTSLSPTTGYPSEAYFLHSANGLIPTYPLSPAAFAASTAADAAVSRHVGLSGGRGRRMRGADIAIGGRRGVELGLGISDHDGVLDDKDALPAYDMYGGPPKYMDVERGGGGQAVTAGVGTRIAESMGGFANRIVERLQGNRTPAQSRTHLPETNTVQMSRHGSELELQPSLRSLRGDAAPARRGSVGGLSHNHGNGGSMNANVGEGLDSVSGDDGNVGVTGGEAGNLRNANVVERAHYTAV